MMQTFTVWYMEQLVVRVRIRELTVREHCDLLMDFRLREMLAMQALIVRE